MAFDRQRAKTRSAEWLSMHDSRLTSRATRALLRRVYPFPDVVERRPLEWLASDVPIHEFTDAIVAAHSSAIIADGRVYLESVRGAKPAEANYAAPPVLSHGRASAYIVPPRSTRRIRRPALSLLGNGAFNYYHWMVELLPRLRFLPDIRRIHPDAVVLAPRSVAETPQLLEALTVLAPDVEIDWVDPSDPVTVDRLAVPAHATLAVFNKRGSHRFRRSDFSSDPVAARWVRDRLLETLEPPSDAPTRRLFLGRPSDRRRYNQDQVFDVVAERGYEMCQPETLSLREQMEAFRDAAIVVGPTGAAWTNLLFCRPGTTALCWLPAEYGDFRAFSDLAEVGGVDFRMMTFRTASGSTADLYERPMTVPLGPLAEHLDGL